MLSPPLSETFIHRQTTAGQVRFTTLPLSRAGNAHPERRQPRAGDRKAALCRPEGRDSGRSPAPIGAAARALAEIDLAAALGRSGRGRGLVRAAGRRQPRLPGRRRAASGGGTRAAPAGRRPFVANDCALTRGDTPAIWLLTGPNMAGKSTFLRQNALIALLAQAGSYVPADQRPYRAGQPAVQPGRRLGRSGARAVDLHGGDGGDRRDPEPGRRPRAGDPGRDRPRHGHL